jgi:hypothetical protein
MGSLKFAIYQNDIPSIRYCLDIKNMPLMTNDILETTDEKTLLFLLNHYNFVDLENLDKCYIHMVQNNISKKVLVRFIHIYQNRMKVKYNR